LFSSLPISSLGQGFFGSLSFWALSVFLLSITWLIYSWKDFLPFCGWPLQFRNHFLYHTEAF
jgi:hypothetical protein